MSLNGAIADTASSRWSTLQSKAAVGDHGVGFILRETRADRRESCPRSEEVAKQAPAVGLKRNGPGIESGSV
jgi:hypothetical protein